MSNAKLSPKGPGTSAAPAADKSASPGAAESGLTLPSHILSGHGPFRAPRGAQRLCLGWGQEAALRMLLNNLDPEVAERPDVVVVEPAGTAVEDAEGTDRNAVGTAEHDAGVGPDLCRTDDEVVVGESGIEAGILDDEQVTAGSLPSSGRRYGHRSGTERSAGGQLAGGDADPGRDPGLIGPDQGHERHRGAQRARGQPNQPVEPLLGVGGHHLVLSARSSPA